MAAEAYGKLETHYRADPIKIILNLGAALILLVVAASAGYLAGVESNNLFWIPALAAGVGGAAILIRTLLRNVAHGVKVYEKGVEVIIRGRRKRYFYDQLSGVRISAAEGRTMYSYLITAYEFYDDEKEVFRVEPIYPDWQELGEILSERVAAFQARSDVDRIRNGYEAIYDEFTAPGPGRRMVIKVTLQGVAEEGKSVLPWDNVHACELDPDDRGMVTVQDQTGAEYTRFRYFNAVNSLTAMKTIDMMAKLRGRA